MDISYEIMQSYNCVDGNVNSTEALLGWIEKLNNETQVRIEETAIDSSTFWFYDPYDGVILNRKNSFFSVKGARYYRNDNYVCEQPIIIQPEIGYLGIICKKIDGVLNFLMQAKIEPGNVNVVQISPTIQATKSNFTRAHGGKMPMYFEYFDNANVGQVVYDQIQSEQSARFYKKRNRNIIVYIENDIELYSTFKWMTLGQIKKLMQIDNLVNMDTRTVLSGLPIVRFDTYRQETEGYKKFFRDHSIYSSLYNANVTEDVRNLYSCINSYKMFNDYKTIITPLNQLIDWKVDDYGVRSNKSANFDVRFFDIEIEGREVRKWMQPLFCAAGKAIFGLLTREYGGKRQFLVKVIAEIGCLDKMEIGPTIQHESNQYGNVSDGVEELFYSLLIDKSAIAVDVILSEEGGRFYHEENRNVIMDIGDRHISLPKGYFWVDLASLMYLVRINNCLNIQLRNLISLLKL